MTRPDGVAPIARTDVAFVVIEDEGLVFDSHATKLHRLNTTGVRLWNLCDGTNTVSELIHKLAAEFGGPSDEIASDVARMIDELDEAQLLGCSPLSSNTPTSPRPNRDLPSNNGAPTSPAAIGHMLGPFRAIDHSFVVACSGSDDVAAELSRVFAPLAAPADDPELYTVWLDGSRWWVTQRAAAMWSATATGIVGHVVSLVNRAAVSLSDRYLLLHAAAVGLDGAAVVLPAASNSGKSTLATALVSAGFDYLTDEAVAIDLDACEVIPFPKAITIGDGARAMFAHLEPPSDLSDPQRWHVSPLAIANASVAGRLPLKHLVFPKHQPEASNSLEPLTTADATVEVITNAFNFISHANRFGDVVELVDSCSRHRLEHNGIDEPVEAIRSLW